MLEAYLLAGLITHKAVWEIMKRRQPARVAKKRAQQPVRTSLVKTVKVAVLLAVAAQILLPPVFPLASDPSLVRALGALVYTAGLALAIAGRVQLGDNWLDIEDAGVKRDQAVVATGVYRVIRHPIYVGDLLLLIGLEFALNSWLAVVALALVPVVLRQAVREEQFLKITLAGYDDYCRRTKRFVPFLA